ncbi:hypothetical protein K503DRAFT_861626 [Rhizopogon vinicolor AM-OR11-026]|uniref:Uncharacterized protein n=1 Tax=Rhizopogon vinicolor AM-OR11-026 TaxID=1314800 RepID=A0A1B7NHK8_9AGAM|nr:hypothetical protein K503DRAFT_861626 [Rhizopogon vinicolor AM-OR11-026]
MPRPLTAESSEELEEPSSSQLAHEGEKSPQKTMIKLDDIKIERESKKRDKEDEDYIESSQGSTSTEASMEGDDEDSVGSNEGATTPTAGSQNGDDDTMDDEETDGEPQFQSSPASSQSTQHNPGGDLTTEQLLLLNRYNIIPHDLKAIGRFLEHNGYSKDQKKVAMAVGWRIDSEGLKLVKNCIAQRGYGTTSGRLID